MVTMAYPPTILCTNKSLICHKIIYDSYILLGWLVKWMDLGRLPLNVAHDAIFIVIRCRADEGEDLSRNKAKSG